MTKKIWTQGVILLAFMLLVCAFASADLAAVSQLGYHPNSNKQVVVYTSASSGSFDIRDAGSNAVVATFTLQKAKNFNGNNVNCQGNLPCLIGIFTSFTSSGNYYIQTNAGLKSPQFNINSNVYSNTIPLFVEFFNAQLQQGSNFHEDLHANHNPPLNIIADGSFIMEADQAALSLIRLGSAYRRNPALFQNADIKKHIISYVHYLKGLQGVKIQERTDGIGFRLNPSMKILNAFVPGPTSKTSLDIFIPGNPPQFLETVPVVSLCGSNDGTATWQQCMNTAASYYKCQADEPCLDVKYIEKTGVLLDNNDGFDVSQGWGYEFGCYFDVNVNQAAFASKPNPCTIFYPQSNRKYTVMTLLGYLEAIPAVYDGSQNDAQTLFSRSVSTYQFIKNNYGGFSSSDSEIGFWGSALFLLYDYSNDVKYLQEAYNLRNSISTTFVSDSTRGNEFYWEEYVRHKSQLAGAGLAYAYNGQNPEEFFRGKLFYDYKDAGQNSISNNGERIFQFDPNIQFQNSRYMLTEGLLATKGNRIA